MRDAHLDIVNDKDFAFLIQKILQDILEPYFKGAPIGLVDIGARGGVCAYFNCISPIVEVLAIEPCEESLEELIKVGRGSYSDITYSNNVVWKESGTVQFNHCRESTNDSIHKVNEALTEKYHLDKFAQSATVDKECKALDEIIYDDYCSNSFGELLKIDTQGTEYEILEGANRLLQERTVGIVTEVSFLEIYKGQKLFSDVENILRKQGFNFYGFLNVSHRSSGSIRYHDSFTKERLFQADAMFIKSEQNNKLNVRELFVMITFSVICGYFDQALSLIDMIDELNCSEKNEISACILKLATTLHGRGYAL